VLFTDATSPVTWTLPGHMTMLCGLDPPIHGCVSGRHRYPPERLPFPLLFELLAEVGYAPMAVTGGGYMDPCAGFGRGVDDFRIITPIMEALGSVQEHLSAHDRTFSFFHTYAVHDYPRVKSRPGALAYLEERDPDYEGVFPTDKDFHSLLNAMAASPDPPRATQRDVAYVQDLYDAAIQSADAALGHLFQQLRKLGIWDQTTIVITSDHGESLGDPHGDRLYWTHGGPPYQEQLRIPLIIRPAMQLRSSLCAGSIVDEAVSLSDLGPTLLDLAGVPFDRQQFDGTSMVELCMGQVAAFETRTLFFHSCEDTLDRYLDPRLYGTALTWHANTKLLYDHRTGALREFYRLETDPHEQNNRIEELGQDELKSIDETIARYWEQVSQRAHKPEAKLIDDPVVLERLALLGYIEK
jgi:arylsulfatase A-like enzyme